MLLPDSSFPLWVIVDVDQLQTYPSQAASIAYFQITKAAIAAIAITVTGVAMIEWEQMSLRQARWSNCWGG